MNVKVTVVGLGSIGGWVAARLAVGGHAVSGLARGATLQAVRERGLLLAERGERISVPIVVSADVAAMTTPDLLVLATKSQALPELAPRLAALMGPRTLVLPLLNGVPWWFMGQDESLRSVDPDGALAQAFPHDRVIGSVVHGSAAQVAPGEIVLRMADRIILGEPAGAISPRLERVAAMLQTAGLPAVCSDRIRQEVWFKLWGNMTLNPISALTLATADRMLDDPLVEGLISSVMEEARAIGEGIGCPLRDATSDRNAVTRKLGAFKTSMLQDVEAGRGLELDALLDAPREIAQGLGIETPTMDALFGLARLMGQSRGLYPR